jgi:hypothetical protein
VQLLPTLVKPVEQFEEGARVGNVDHHRHVHRARRLPHRVKARVVDLDERPGVAVIAGAEAERLEDLQAAGAKLVCANHFAGLELGVAGLVHATPPRLGEHDEPLGVRRHVRRDRLSEARAVAAGEVHHHADVFRVHHRQKFRRLRDDRDLVAGLESFAPRQVRVEFEHGKPRLR